MTAMYVILGWIGWIWFAVVVAFVAGYLKGQRDLARRAAAAAAAAAKRP